MLLKHNIDIRLSNFHSIIYNNNILSLHSLAFNCICRNHSSKLIKENKHPNIRIAKILYYNRNNNFHRCIFCGKFVSLDDMKNYIYVENPHQYSKIALSCCNPSEKVMNIIYENMSMHIPLYTLNFSLVVSKYSKNISSKVQGNNGEYIQKIFDMYKQDIICGKSNNIK